MPDYASNAGQIMVALRDLVKDQQPRDLASEELEVREDWLSATGDPFRGVSVVYQGEQYSEGTVGTQDVGYIIGIVFAKHRTADASLPDDKIMEWYEKTRRRCADQRLGITITNSSSPKEHVMILMPGRTLTNVSKWPNFLLRQMVIAVWHRELPTT